MSILADDLAVMFTDTMMTVSVVFGAQSTRGILRRADMVKADPSQFEVFIRMWTLTVMTGTLTNPTAGAAITVDGNPYTIHDVSRKFVRSQFSPPDDGRLTELVLVTP